MKQRRLKAITFRKHYKKSNIAIAILIQKLYHHNYFAFWGPKVRKLAGPIFFLINFKMKLGDQLIQLQNNLTNWGIYRWFLSLFKAIAKRLSLLFANAFKSDTIVGRTITIVEMPFFPSY